MAAGYTWHMRRIRRHHPWVKFGARVRLPTGEEGYISRADDTGIIVVVGTPQNGGQRYRWRPHELEKIDE